MEMSDHSREIRQQRKIWESKKILREIYFDWYGKIISNMASGKTSIEIGCGCGNFKSFYPRVTATDVTSNPFAQAVIDANELPFEKGSIDNFIMFDVLHHLEDPMRYFRKAGQSLREKGRIILIEPYVSFFSYFVYKYFHHEKLDFRQNLFHAGIEGGRSGGNFSNTAIPTLLFEKNRKLFQKELPDLKIIKKDLFSFLVYPLSGGFRYKSMIPYPYYRALDNIEKTALKPFSRFLAMRMLIVIEKC